jgi:hypothetical protein
VIVRTRQRCVALEPFRPCSCALVKLRAQRAFRHALSAATHRSGRAGYRTGTRFTCQRTQRYCWHRDPWSVSSSRLGGVAMQQNSATFVNHSVQTSRARASVKMPRPFLVVVIVLSSCGPRDRSITRGADGAHDWSRRLAAAVPLRTLADSARSTMQRNGFVCRAGPGILAELWCDKTSRGGGLAQRRWRAVFTLEGGQVVEVRAATALIPP